MRTPYLIRLAKLEDCYHDSGDGDNDETTDGPGVARDTTAR
jgi:hypothetical protein